jgi:hypothetical protein
MTALGRRLVVGLAGPGLHALEARWLREHQPAGVILFGRNCTDPRQCAQLCADVRACLPAGAEIMADHEGGPVSVLAAALGRPPAAWTLGALDDLGLTRRVHRETGRRLRELGVDRVLAPCCDVLVEPRNPVIGSRAFGDDPARVAAQVAAAVTGLREGGVRTCLKHFPGHGGTAGDSHDGAVGAGAGALAGPFEAGFAAGADGLMVGHIVVGGGRMPLTLDAPALARARATVPAGVRFFADDVTMGGLRPALAALGLAAADGRAEGLVDPADLTPGWLQALAAAGCDVLLVRGIPWRALPLAGGEAGPGLPSPVAAVVGAAPDAAVVGAAPDVPLYGEVRARAAAGLVLADPGGVLLWLDATGGDRWGEAAGLQPWLEARFGRVVRVGPGGSSPLSVAATTLLVTSHRPLGAGVGEIAMAGLGRAGEAVAAGHPSLGTELAGRLGAGWRVRALFDMRPEDLAAAVPKAGGRI